MRLLAPRLLTHPLVLHIDEAIEKGDPIPHEVEQMLQLGALVGIPPVPRGLDVPVSEEDLEWARTILDGHGHRDTIIAFHLSSKWLTGGWTGAHLASLFERLLSEIPGSSLLVTYGPADADAVVRYGEGAEERGAPHDERIHLVGNLTFGKWAALFRRGSVVVTPDTGALHVAAAAGRPVVAVYEKKSFYHCSRQWAPWRIPARIIEKNKYEETADAIAGALRYLLEEQSRKGAND
jgi:ADP-heptose:LPS heptosyltransferase